MGDAPHNAISMAKLIDEIETFLQQTEMSPSYFGRLAVNDGKFVDRLRSGGDVTTTTQANVQAFMRDYVPKATRTEAAA